MPFIYGKPPRKRRKGNPQVQALVILMGSNILIFAYNFVVWPLWLDPSLTEESPPPPPPPPPLLPSTEPAFPEPEPLLVEEPLQVPHQAKLFNAAQMGLRLMDDAARSVGDSSSATTPQVAQIAAAARGAAPAPLLSSSSSSSSFRVLTIPVYYLHIYKSGGTSFCATAQRARKRVPVDRTRQQQLNCNVPHDLIRRGVGEQLKHVRQYDVSANEHDGLPLLESMLLPPAQVAYVVTLREPHDRFLSHFRAAQQFSVANRGAYRDVGGLAVPRAGGASAFGRPCLFHHCAFPDFLHWLEGRRRDPSLAPASLRLPWTLGDFALRYFVGFDACDPGACSDYHLVQAKDRLERLFTVVLVLEELEDTGWRTMRAAFGWPSEAEVRRAGTRRGSSAFAELEAHHARGGAGWAAREKSMRGFEAATGGGGGGGGGGGLRGAPLGPDWGGAEDVEDEIRRQVEADHNAALDSLSLAVGPRDVKLYEYARGLSHRRAEEIFRAAGIAGVAKTTTR